ANRVYEDGTDYEKSTSYQRLVTEMFTAAYVLLKLNKFKISGEFSGRLEKMFAFLASATMRDGRVPNIGDGDDGRIFRMKSNMDFNDHRDLLSVGAALFGRGDLKTAAGEFSELALLLLGGEGFENFSLIKPENRIFSSIYKDGGFAFMRTEKDFCSLDFGDIGMRGRGGHGHNDTLSFTVAGKNPFIVDRGTFCYTSDTVARNKLRSTYSHNTVIVDGAEQAEFAGPWSVKADLTSPALLEWNSTPEQDIIEAQHRAYERLIPPVTHRRKITFNKRQRTFLVGDNLLGTGPHTVEMMFHFAPELKVVDLGRSFLALEGEEFALVKFQHPFTLEEWQHSPSYAVLQAARTARVRLEIDLPARIETFIFVISSADDMNHLLNRIQSVDPPE
ncbi:MAG TPA: alginate lyase family protein, partial [Candidatus Kryptobacter bacterium]|nr:alginate lyase family protein [Candidatus Kryptobacter bacterium]